MFIVKKIYRHFTHRLHPLSTTDYTGRLSFFLTYPWRSKLSLGIITAFFIGFTVAIPIQNVSALTKTQDLGTTDMAKSFAAYRWLRSCLDRGNFSKFDKSGAISQDQVNNFKWFGGAIWGVDTNISTSGVINEPNDGDTSCTQDEGPALIGSSLNLWGYSSGADFLCDIGFTRDVGTECAVISSGNNDFISPGGVSKMDSWWKSKMGNSSTDLSSIKIGGEYSLYLQSFLAKCGTPSSSGEYSIQTFSAGSLTPTITRYTAIDSGFTKTSGDVRVYQDKSMKCSELADYINDASDPAVLNYIQYLKAHNNLDTGAVVNSCPAGSTDPKCQPGQSTSSCAIEGIGWLVCPVTNFLANVADNAFTFLSDSFLQVKPDTFADGGAAYKVWSSMRTIANIAFVIAFLIIIFSQLTGQGIANYGIKKMLPRLVIAAILVNMSFVICQVAIDISNIVGVSIRQLFSGVGDNFKLPTSIGDESGNWVGIAAAVLAGGGIAWGLGISVLAPFLLGAVVAFIMVFLILIVRQVLIILLVVVAPIAFVAFLLPNTEQWFTKWRKMFVGLLIVFPLIGLLFGAADLASGVMKSVSYYNTSGAAAGSSSNDAANWIMKIVAQGLIALPLFLLPGLLRKSIDAAGNIGQTMNKLSNSFGGGASKRLGNSGVMKNYAARKAEKRMAISTGTYGGRNPLSKLRSRVNSGLNSSGAFNAVTGGFGAERTLTGQATQRKDSQEAMAMFGGDDALVEAWASSGGNLDQAISSGKVKAGSAQAEQFKLMVNAGHAKKPTSFLAAAQYLSENGKSDAYVVQNALANAQKAGASDIQVGGALAAATAAYRKSGRGDALAVLSNAMEPDATKHITMAQGWSQVAPSAVHRDGIKAGSVGLTTYEEHLAANPENTRQALAGFDSMEQRARKSAEASILTAAQNHEMSTTGSSTITSIREAKDYFGVK